METLDESAGVISASNATACRKIGQSPAYRG
jgi:hypothetical protein